MEPNRNPKTLKIAFYGGLALALVSFISLMIFSSPKTAQAQTATTYALYVPSVFSGLGVQASSTAIVACNGIGGWSKDPQYYFNATTSEHRIDAPNTYTFTMGSNLYPDFASVSAVYGSGQYLFYCNNLNLMIWYSESGIPLNDSLIQSTVVPQDSFISILAPSPYSTTTATTSVYTDVLFLYNGSIATTTRAEYRIFDAVTNEQEHYIFQLIPADVAGINFQINQSYNMATGSKIMIARYVTASENIDLLPQKQTFFNVVDNSYLLATGLESPLANPFELSQIDCDTFDVGCQFQKALVFLFIPPQNVLDRFLSTWNDLLVVKPFGYITALYRQLNGLNIDGTPTYTMPSVPFVDTIFSPIRDVLSPLMWALFAFFFYRRVKDIQI